MLYRFALCCFLSCVVAGYAAAQNNANSNNLTNNSAEKGRSNDRDDDNIRLGTMESEMLSRRRLDYDRKKHQDHLARAKELGALSLVLKGNFARNQSLAAEDLRKLERVEKLARRIREYMSDDSDATPLAEDEKPATLAEAMTRLEDGSETLEKQVNETPRNVISAGVVEKACEVEALARYIRERWPARN